MNIFEKAGKMALSTLAEWGFLLEQKSLLKRVQEQKKLRYTTMNHLAFAPF